MMAPPLQDLRMLTSAGYPPQRIAQPSGAGAIG